MRLDKNNLGYLGYNLELLSGGFVDLIKDVWCEECERKTVFIPTKIKFGENEIEAVQCNRCEMKTNNIDKIVEYNKEKYNENN